MKSVTKYGVEWADKLTPAFIELAMAFDVRGGSSVSLHTASGFLGAFEHLKNGIDLIWNREKKLLIWNEWSELLLRSFIENREIPVAGPAASWKSTCAAIYVVAFWAADPLRSKVIPSSTTLGGLRERIWKDIVHFYHAARFGYGNVVQHPTPKIQTIKGDDSTGIHGVAVEQGDIQKAIDKIKGRHAPRVLIAIDEGTGAQQAIVDACANLETGCERFQLIMLANPSSYFDQHGRLSEPEHGWGSISVASETWRTKRGGIAVHLDGVKSPNVLAGYKKYPGMISQEDLDIAARRDGENSPRFWQERRGFWAPEGITKTVLTETIIEKFHARDTPVWTGETMLCAAFDPAYEGGDKKVLGFAEVGEIVEPSNDPFTVKQVTRTAFCFVEVLNLKVDLTSKEPIHYQLARQVREECKSRGVEAEYFAMDVSGEGQGTADILKREWSQDFLCVEFGGRASDRRVSDINPRPGYEEYYNRVSQLWYQFRRGVERGQIYGMTPEMCRQACQRNYEMVGPKIRVESKTLMKSRIGHSPDDMDMAVVMHELVIERDLISSDVREELSDSHRNRWVEFARNMSCRNEYALPER